MQESRKFALVVSLCAALFVGAAMTGAPAAHHRHRAGAADDSVVDTILDYITLASRILIPPG